MKTTRLFEAASLTTAGPSADGTWRVRLISEGQGSSGYYSKELLENFGHVFEGALSYKNHPVGESGLQSRDFTMISGRLVGGIDVVEEADGRTALYGNYLPDPDYAEKLERYKDALGLSIFASGAGEYDENDDFIVTEFAADDPYRSVDVVVAPGARGEFLAERLKEMYVSSVEDASKPSVTVAQEVKEGDTMELEKAIEALTAKVDALIADKEKAVAAEAQAEADAQAVAAAVEQYSAAVEAVDAAELLDVQKAEILEAAKSGADIEQMIESAKKIKEAAVKAVSEAHQAPVAEGVVVSSPEGFSLTEIAGGTL